VRHLFHNGSVYLRAAYPRSMARPPRAFVEGIYHLGSQGSETRQLFLGDGDRATFLARLALILERFELRLVAYTLMGNHYHLVLFTPDGRVSRALQQLHGWYSLRHNRVRGRRAHLFRAHFFARELGSDADLLGACRYLAYNPVDAGLADHPFAWRWSSSAASAGLCESPLPLDPAPLRSALGNRSDWRLRYRAFIETAENETP
jgi:REP element-mobilizing transposase RayT